MYCAGGDKNKQLDTWLGKLKKNDIALIHGYPDDVKDSDLETHCKACNAEIIEQEWFGKIAGSHIALKKN